jgi:hypothetical protein
MMHDDNDWAKMVLDDLAKYTDKVYVNLNDATPEITEIVNHHSVVVKSIITTNNGRPWNQGLIRDLTIRMLDDVKPDIVLFPDSDEVYPDNLKQVLEDFWKSPFECLWFNLLYLWDDPQHARRDSLFKSMHHVRAFKWREGLTFLPQSGYGAKPVNSENVGYKFHASAPMRHYGYMTEESRIKKYTRWGDKRYLDPKYRERTLKDIRIIDV